jgi:NAD(P)H-dependent FMN reductase
MPRLLLVHHTVSPTTEELFEAARRGTRDEAIVGVDVVVVPALSASVPEVLAADGYLLGTPANIGYISGALKHFFDTIYYPCRAATEGRPYAAYVHGNLDGGGAVRAIETITTGLGWKPVAPVLAIAGTVGRPEREAAYDLGATIAATLAGL